MGGGGGKEGKEEGTEIEEWVGRNPKVNNSANNKNIMESEGGLSESK